MRRTKNTAAFSLVELMIVVAIIGILAAIAVPNYITMQLKAKRGEIPVALDGIRTCESAYSSAFDGYISTPVAPRPDSDLNKRLFDWITSPEWTQLGFFPNGAVRGNYQVNAGATDFTVYGHGDMDDDDTMVVFTASADLESAITNVSVNEF